MMSGAAAARIAAREAERFRAANPRAFAHHAAATGWFQSVPFHWMKDWPSPVPIVAVSAKDATLTSIDGQTYDDFCLGDTASLFGHSPPPLMETAYIPHNPGQTFCKADTPRCRNLPAPPQRDAKQRRNVPTSAAISAGRLPN